MREINQATAVTPADPGSLMVDAPPERASGWRAFFSVLIMGLCVSGNARPDPSDYATRFQWQQMVMAISACSFGALAAAGFAVRWRKLGGYWSIVWRLYLVYVAAAFLAGFLHGGNIAGYATGAAMLAGMVTAMSGTALFYWRNTGTNLFFYLSCFLILVGMAKAFLF
jgi:hypothetical protein